MKMKMVKWWNDEEKQIKNINKQMENKKDHCKNNKSTN